MRVVASFLRPVGERAELTLEVPSTTPGSPRWPRSPSPPGGSSARSATCTASAPRTTRCPSDWCATATGPPATTRCAATPIPTPRFDPDIDSYPFIAVEGDGVYEIPVGPIHAGLIEPGHFRFSVVGETILQMKARLWFLHRGVEKLFEGADPAAGHRAGRAHQRRHRRRATPWPTCWPSRTPWASRSSPRPRRSAPCCSRSSASTTTSTTWAPSPTTSATASPTPTPSACASTCCATTRHSPGTGCCAGGSASAAPTSPRHPTST